MVGWVPWGRGLGALGQPVLGRETEGLTLRMLPRDDDL